MDNKERIARAIAEAEKAGAKVRFHYEDSDDEVSFTSPREDAIIYVTFDTVNEGLFTDKLSDLYE